MLAHSQSSQLAIYCSKNVLRLLRRMFSKFFQQEIFVKFPECSRVTFSKNIPKMFCDNLLIMVSDITWTFNVLSGTFSKNSTCIYIALFPVLATFTHSHTHPYTDDGGCHARCQLHIRSNLGFSIFLKATSTRNSTEPGFQPVTFWSLDNLLYPLSYSRPKHLVLNVPECLRRTFSKNIPKMFCDNLLKMFSDNITWTLGPNVLENVLSRKFLLSSQSVRW